jgi:hypothetical protein
VYDGSWYLGDRREGRDPQHVRTNVIIPAAGERPVTANFPR